MQKRLKLMAVLIGFILAFLLTASLRLADAGKPAGAPPPAPPAGRGDSSGVPGPPNFVCDFLVTVLQVDIPACSSPV